MEAELIALISLLSMTALCSGILAIIKSVRLCNIARITPLVVLVGNIPLVVVEHSRNVPRQRT